MKTIVLHLLLAIFVFTSTAIGQLAKLPALLTHYTEHSTENKSLSFVDYLKMHYLTATDGDNDTERDMQLPFKKITNTVVAYVFTPQPSIIFTTKATYAISTKQTLFRYLAFIPTSAIGVVIEPPEFC